MRAGHLNIPVPTCLPMAARVSGITLIYRRFFFFFGFLDIDIGLLVVYTDGRTDGRTRLWNEDFLIFSSFFFFLLYFSSRASHKPLVERAGFPFLHFGYLALKKLSFFSFFLRIPVCRRLRIEMRIALGWL